jgi:hypothetical protein
MRSDSQVRGPEADGRSRSPLSQNASAPLARRDALAPPTVFAAAPKSRTLALARIAPHTATCILQALPPTPP